MSPWDSSSGPHQHHHEHDQYWDYRWRDQRRRRRLRRQGQQLRFMSTTTDPSSTRIHRPDPFQPILQRVPILQLLLLILFSTATDTTSHWNYYSVTAFHSPIIVYNSRRIQRTNRGSHPLVLSMVSSASSSSSLSSVPSSSASSSSSTLTTEDGCAFLQGLTLKELRELVVAQKAERGVLSRLKRKQDFVDYLQQLLLQPQLQSSSTTTAIATPLSATATAPSTSAFPTKPVPPLMDSPLTHKYAKDPDNTPFVAATSIDDNSNDDTTETVTPMKSSLPPTPLLLRMPPFQSPKDAIFEQVYQRYPPVRDQQPTSTIAAAAAATSAVVESTLDNDTNINSEGSAATVVVVDDDVRQVYHPAVGHLKASDMDIVCAGTASCTPGTTRGVSCTAIRLNWSRRGLVGDPTTTAATASTNKEPSSAGPTTRSFQGGTWLFDVGECTQVSEKKRVYTTSAEQYDENRDAGTSPMYAILNCSACLDDIHLFNFRIAPQGHVLYLYYISFKCSHCSYQILFHSLILAPSTKNNCHQTRKDNQNLYHACARRPLIWTPRTTMSHGPSRPRTRLSHY